MAQSDFYTLCSARYRVSKGVLHPKYKISCLRVQSCPGGVGFEGRYIGTIPPGSAPGLGPGAGGRGSSRRANSWSGVVQGMDPLGRTRLDSQVYLSQLVKEVYIVLQHFENVRKFSGEFAKCNGVPCSNPE